MDFQPPPPGQEGKEQSIGLTLGGLGKGSSPRHVGASPTRALVWLASLRVVFVSCGDHVISSKRPSLVSHPEVAPQAPRPRAVPHPSPGTQVPCTRVLARVHRHVPEPGTCSVTRMCGFDERSVNAVGCLTWESRIVSRSYWNVPSGSKYYCYCSYLRAPSLCQTFYVRCPGDLQNSPVKQGFALLDS